MAERAQLLYDRDCGFCRWCTALVLRRDRERRLEPLELQSERARDLTPELGEQQRAASWHLIGPDGRRHSAGAAFAPLLELLGRPRAAAAAQRATPLLKVGYRAVAGSRSVLGRLVPAGAKRRADAEIAARSGGASI